MGAECRDSGVSRLSRQRSSQVLRPAWRCAPVWRTRASATAHTHLAGAVPRLEAQHLRMDSRFLPRAIHSRKSGDDTAAAQRSQTAAAKQRPGLRADSHSQLAAACGHMAAECGFTEQSLGNGKRCHSGQRPWRLPDRGHRWQAARVHNRGRQPNGADHKNRARNDSRIRVRPADEPAGDSGANLLLCKSQSSRRAGHAAGWPCPS